MNRAASLSFYTLVSIFPMVMVLASVTGYFLPRDWLEGRFFDLLSEALPLHSSLIESNIRALFRKRLALSGFGVGALIVSSQMLYVNFERHINNILHTDKKRNFLLSRLVFVVWLLGMVLVILSPILVNMVSVVFGGIGLHIPYLPHLPLRTGYMTAGFFMFILIMLVMPTRRVQIKRVALGGFLFSVAIELGKMVFAVFMRHSLNRYDLVYGSLSSLMIVMVWIFYFYNIFLFCVYWAGKHADPFAVWHMDKKTTSKNGMTQ